jgi:hypothetical protein
MTIASNTKNCFQSNTDKSIQSARAIDGAKRAPFKTTGHLNPRTSDLLVAIRRVLGARILSAKQIVERLKKRGVVLRTREPEMHLRWILASNPRLFVSAPEQRGLYRLLDGDPYRSAADDDGQQPVSQPHSLCET